MQLGTRDFNRLEPENLIYVASIVICVSDVFFAAFSALNFAGKSKAWKMITDIQLAVFSNILGVSIFLLVILYHYINANSSK
ncbi:hypothetical protein K1T71_010057 [Dendrolimus kikuchii]|uniref:Uncharacterized protein n=1 Tax=Dendrolimus kikuchii TaxID=765133 RepID=A0ACC1CQL9_9NEOP|nr:hypothetical protein K1T71_010057 [Dendrolimus kikuchii]